MRVLMIGWELPPYNSGGLGVACYHLAHHLAQKGIDLTFLLPQRKDFQIHDFKLLFADAIPENELLFPAYTSLGLIKRSHGGENFPFDLLDRVRIYAQRMGKLLAGRKFDLVHAHDWLCFPAGIAAAQVLGKPLVVHVHITEFDKTGGGSIDQRVYEIEKEGMEKAAKVITISQMMKKRITDSYNISPEKVALVYNGVERGEWQGNYALPRFKTEGKKIVLFLGRLTLQKGPDWFLKAAAKVLAVDPNVIFVFVGSGEMMPQLIQQAAEIGIVNKVFFTGWLRDDERVQIYKAADLYVMPSVSDPFGLTALEAMASGTPVLISRQVGAGEILNHVLKVDFWDVDQMAGKILAALKYQPLAKTLKDNGMIEIGNFGWDRAADKCQEVYQPLVS